MNTVHVDSDELLNNLRTFPRTKFSYKINQFLTIFMEFLNYNKTECIGKKESLERVSLEKDDGWWRKLLRMIEFTRFHLTPASYTASEYKDNRNIQNHVMSWDEKNVNIRGRKKSCLTTQSLTLHMARIIALWKRIVIKNIFRSKIH